MSGPSLTADSGAAAVGALLRAGQSVCSFHLALRTHPGKSGLSGILCTSEASHSLVRQFQTVFLSSELLLGPTERGLASELGRSPLLTDALPCPALGQVASPKGSAIGADGQQPGESWPCRASAPSQCDVDLHTGVSVRNVWGDRSRGETDPAGWAVPLSPRRVDRLRTSRSPHLTASAVAVNSSCDAFPPSALVHPHTSGRQLGIKRRVWTLGLNLGSAIRHSWAPWPCCFAALSFPLGICTLGVRASVGHCGEDCVQ